MPDPQYGFDFGTTQQEHNYPDIAVSPNSFQELDIAASNVQAGAIGTEPEKCSNFAYDTAQNPVSSHADHYYASNNSTAPFHDPAATAINLSPTTNKESFASGSHNTVGIVAQSWPSLVSPYVSFAPPYEQTGELAPENIHNLCQFDNPTPVQSQNLRAQDSRSEAVFIQPPHPSEFRDRGSETILHNTAEPGLKRRRQTDANETIDRNSNTLQPPAPATSGKSRSVPPVRMSGPVSISPDGGSTSSEVSSAQRPPMRSGPSANLRRGRAPATGDVTTIGNNVSQPSTAPQAAGRPSRGNRDPGGHPPPILPPEKVFPIQIGSELFRLSGASISSDAPSYFTQFFEEQIRQNEESGGVRTLYIDRDPATFRDIARHLQGYYVKPIDGSHFVKLFADAQFYSLPRLIDQLFESEIFIQIGEKHFQIPKDIFSDPGNSPNFFSLGFAVFFSTPGEVFPGLDRRGLLRPPSITPPYVPGRSAEIFAQILHLLRGYPLHIRNEPHRAELLRDCRYFHLRGLEQKLIAHEIAYNLERGKTEISLRIEDVKPSGISYQADEAVSDQDNGGWVYYARPFVDDKAYELVVEIGGETTILDLTDMRADFHGLTKARAASLFQVIANKMNLPSSAPLGLMMLSGGSQSLSASPGNTPISKDRVLVRIEPATDVTLDGQQYDIDWSSSQAQIMFNGPRQDMSKEHDVQRQKNDDANDEDDDDDSDAMSQDLSDCRNTEGSMINQRLQGSQPKGPTHGSYAPVPVGSRGLTDVAPTRKRKRPTTSSSNICQSPSSACTKWTIRTAQWRLRLQRVRQNPSGMSDPANNPKSSGGYEIIFVAVKIDAFTEQRARNRRKSWIGGKHSVNQPS